MELVRWTTVHPLLVHFSLGTLPVLLIAYGVAARWRSPGWTHAGDMTLFITAAITVVTLGTGLLSNALLPWPGGLGTWRYLHLGLAIASTVLLLVLASVRFVKRRASQRATGFAMFSAVVGLSGVLAMTGWIGGEVLVFHSGMAVKAAANGALAAPISESPVGRAGNDGYDSLKDSMHAIRGHWGQAATELAQMMVEHPDAARFGRIAASAIVVKNAAAWIANNQPPAMAFMANTLQSKAAQLQEAAQARNLVDLAQAYGSLTSTCAGCHHSFRWREPLEPG